MHILFCENTSTPLTYLSPLMGEQTTKWFSLLGGTKKTNAHFFSNTHPNILSQVNGEHKVTFHKALEFVRWMKPINFSQMAFSWVMNCVFEAMFPIQGPSIKTKRRKSYTETMKLNEWMIHEWIQKDKYRQIQYIWNSKPFNCMIYYLKKPVLTMF